MLTSRRKVSLARNTLIQIIYILIYYQYASKYYDMKLK